MLPPFMRGVEALVTPATGLHAQYYMLLRTLAAQGVRAPWQNDAQELLQAGQGRANTGFARSGDTQHRRRPGAQRSESVALSLV